MKTIIIQESKRGIVRHHGKTVGILLPGRHWSWRWSAHTAVELVDARQLATPSTPELERVLTADLGQVLEVAEGAVALVRRDGLPLRVLDAGRWIIWHGEGEVAIAIASLEPLRTVVPSSFWAIAGSMRILDVVVRPHQCVLVYVDGVLAESLGAGRHGLSTWRRKIELVPIDLREQQLLVAGQELITADKATLRLTLLLKYAVVEPVATVQSVTDLGEALYAEVQMAARAAIAGVTLDGLLERRVEVAREMTAAVTERVAAWGVGLRRLEIKDVVLPGELRELMNRVIEAEKRAAAQVILRREEVAATRSLANTARLLENNPVLLRLKETEAMKEIADKVENLTVVVAPKDLQDVLRLGARA